MSHLNCFLPLAAAWVLIGAASGPVTAVAQSPGAWAAPTNGAPAVRMNLEPGEIIGWEQVRRQAIRLGTNEFNFVVPEDLRAGTTADGAILLSSAEQTYFVTVRVLPGASSDEVSDSALRQNISTRFCNAAAPEAYVVSVAGRPGQGLVFTQTPPKVGPRSVRIIRVPFRAGVVEFVLNADATHELEGKGALDRVLLTFRSNEDGPLEIIRRSDES